LTIITVTLKIKTHDEEVIEGSEFDSVYDPRPQPE
jgi:hypothetical protein